MVMVVILCEIIALTPNDKSMTIHLNPVTEKVVQEELENGHFRSIEEIIVQGVLARREKQEPPRTEVERHQAVERALDFARHRAISLEGVSIKELLHEGHRL